MHFDVSADLGSVGAAEHRHCEFGSSSTHESSDTNDFACAHVECCCVDDFAVWLGWVVDGPVGD